MSILWGTNAFGNEVFDAWWKYFNDGPAGLVTAGVPEKEAEAAFRQIETIDPRAINQGSWVYEMSMPAHVHDRRAQDLETAGDIKGAVKEYTLAAAYYNAARWPCLVTPEREAAYRSHLDCFLKIVRYSNIPLEIVRIPYEGKHIVGHLYMPKAEKPPVVIWSGGIDGWKTGGLDYKQKFLDEGIAILALDLPGTGESEWTLEATSDRIYSRAADYLKDRGDVDGDHIGVYFGSFSGVYAIKLAILDPDIKAAVNHSGGIHLFFTRKFEAMPPLTMSIGMRAFATIHAMGMDDASLDDIFSTFATFSIKNQGLLKAVPDQAPLLNIYGDKDDLMPIEDLKVLQESGIKSESLVYEGDGHMAWEHAADHQAKTMAFFKTHLFK